MEAAVGSIVSYLLGMGLPGVALIVLGYLYWRQGNKIDATQLAKDKVLEALQAAKDTEVRELNEKITDTLTKVIPLVSDLPEAVAALHSAVDRLDKIADRLGS